MMVIHLLFATH